MADELHKRRQKSISSDTTLDAIITSEMANEYKSHALEQISGYVSPADLSVDLGPARCVVGVGDMLFASGDYENAGYRYSAAVKFVVPGLELLARLRKELDHNPAVNRDNTISLMKMVEAEIRSAHFSEPDTYYFIDLREDWSDILMMAKQMGIKP